jgi:fatty acid desaturase
MKITEILSADEIKALSHPSDIRGWVAVLFDWGLIATAMVCAVIFPNPLMMVAAMIIIGGRQLALAILVHETVHRSLFKTRRLNDLVGRFICGAPVWQDLYRYREHHIKHHAWAGSEKDPDISLIQPFPVSRGSLARKFLRDLTGITGLKRIYALVLMDFGFLTYTIASDPKRVDQSQKAWTHILMSGLRNIWPMIVAQVAIFAVLMGFGHPMLYLLWITSYLTTFSLFLRIRSIAEHACTSMDLDPMKSTRTTWANPLARLTIAPHRVNFHLEHHLQMAVPYFRLPELCLALETKGMYQNAQFASGYLEVLRLATRVPD